MAVINIIFRNNEHGDLLLFEFSITFPAIYENIMIFIEKKTHYRNRL